MIGEEPVTEPTNIQSKHQKHQAFEAELNANTERLHNIMNAGENLIEANQCAGNDEAVKVYNRLTITTVLHNSIVSYDDLHQCYHLSTIVFITNIIYY